MAQRRMMSLDVIDTDAFLDMPMSSQFLYFHLSCRADDDGFISSPKKIVRMLGTSNDDLKLLIAKKFIIPFEDGVCVIKHWRINNFIRKDIYKETQWIEHKKKLYIRKNGAYTLDSTDATPVPTGHFQLENLYVNDTLTTRQLSIGKDRIGKSKESKEKNNKGCYGEFQNVFLSDEEKQKLKDKYGGGASKSLVEELSNYIESSGKKYKNHYATLLNWAKRKGIEERKIYVAVEEPKLTPEQIEKNKELALKVRETLNKKMN